MSDICPVCSTELFIDDQCPCCGCDVKASEKANKEILRKTELIQKILNKCLGEEISFTEFELKQIKGAKEIAEIILKDGSIDHLIKLIQFGGL